MQVTWSWVILQYRNRINMKKTLRLTESELVKLVNRIINEQNQLAQLKKRDKIQVRTKTAYGAEDIITLLVTDVSSDGITVVGMDDEAERYGYLLDRPEKIKFDSIKMDLPDLGKIISVNDKSLEKGSSEKTSKPVVTTPKKKTPQLPDNILKQLREPKEQQDFVLYRFNMGYSEANEKVPVGIKILKDSIDVSDYPSGSNKLWFKRIKAKTTDGKNIILDHRCGYSYSTIAGGPFQLGIKVANPGLSDLLKSYCPLG